MLFLGNFGILGKYFAADDSHGATMPPKKLRYGWERRAWARPNDFLVDSKWTCYYTATGQGQTGKFYI